MLVGVLKQIEEALAVQRSWCGKSFCQQLH